MPINFPRLALVSSSNGDAASPPSAEALILGISAQTGAKRIPASRSPSGACSAKESRGDQSFTCESSSGVMVARAQPPWSTIASLKFSACLRTGLSSLNLTARTNVGSSPPSSSKTNKVMDAFASMEARLKSPKAIPANAGSMAICGSGFTACATATAFCKSFGNAMVFRYAKGCASAPTSSIVGTRGGSLGLAATLVVEVSTADELLASLTGAEDSPPQPEKKKGATRPRRRGKFFMWDWTGCF